MKNISTVFFDFDWVLSKDYFYTKLKKDFKNVFEFIESNIFNWISDIPNLWMKNILTYQDVNKYISQNTWVDYEILTKLFLEGVEETQVDMNLLEIVKVLKNAWKKVWLITNNMDVFNIVTLKKHKLDDFFHLVINSCDYWLLKHEQSWKLFDIAMEKIWENNYSNTLMIDDSVKVYDTFTSKWWNCYKYKNYEDFYLRYNKNILIN